MEPSGIQRVINLTGVIIGLFGIVLSLTALVLAISNSQAIGASIYIGFTGNLCLVAGYFLTRNR